MSGPDATDPTRGSTSLPKPTRVSGRSKPSVTARPRDYQARCRLLPVGIKPTRVRLQASNGHDRLHRGECSKGIRGAGTTRGVAATFSVRGFGSRFGPRPSRTCGLPSRLAEALDRINVRRSTPQFVALPMLVRGQIIMPCGSGKTLVALWISEALSSKRTLVLVPSLSLLAQTLREWTAHAQTPFVYLPVCSDESVQDHDAFVREHD